MPVAWYLGPYDLVQDKRLAFRRCAMARHMPTSGRPDGARWAEIETLGNHALVKVSAPAGVHSQIQADPDFTRIPHEAEYVAPNERAALKAALVAIGWTGAAIEATGYETSAVLRLLASLQSRVRLNPARDRLDVLPGPVAVPAEAFDHVDQRVTA